MIPPGITRFAFIEGYYLFCTLHHSGQASDLYSKLCRIGEYFTPGPMWSESRILENTTGEHMETQEVYRMLCEHYGEGVETCTK